MKRPQKRYVSLEQVQFEIGCAQKHQANERIKSLELDAEAKRLFGFINENYPNGSEAMTEKESTEYHRILRRANDCREEQQRLERRQKTWDTKIKQLKATGAVIATEPMPFMDDPSVPIQRNL